MSKQYQAMFQEENVKLEFSEGAFLAMAQKAKDTGTGARALRMLAESMLRDLMFEVPSDPTIREIYVDKEYITDNQPPRIVRVK